MEEIKPDNPICPYCSEDMFIEIEGMTEDDCYKEKCEHCHKLFEYWIQYSVDGFTREIK